MERKIPHKMIWHIYIYIYRERERDRERDREKDNIKFKNPQNQTLISYL